MKKSASNRLKKRPSKISDKSGILDRYHFLLPYIIIIAAILVVYLRTVWFDYTYSDDDALILKHFDFLNSASSLKDAFLNTYFNRFFAAGFYRPILILSLVIDAQIGGTAPSFYHLSNLLYHIIAGCLLVHVLLKMHFSFKASTFASLLFAIHPLTAQAVSWIPGRNDVLLAIFILLAFKYFISYVNTGEKKDFILHLIAFVLALLTKESAVVLPLLLFFYVTTIKKWTPASAKSRLFIFSWTGILLAWFMLRSWMLHGVDTGGASISLKALFYNIRVLPELIGKLFIPYNLSPYSTFSFISTAIGVICILAVLWYLVFAVRKWADERIFAVGWIILFIIPGLVLLLNEYQYRYDYLEHRAYLSIAGLSLFAAVLLEKFLTGRNRKRMYVPIVILILFSMMAYMQSGFFKDGSVYWSRVIAKSPKAAYAYFGLASFDDAEMQAYPEAEINYKQAIALYPKNALFHSNLGTLYIKQNNLILAESELLLATELDSHNPLYLNNLGVLYGKENKIDRAIEIYTKAFNLKPDDHIPLVNLGYCMFLKGDFSRAEKYYLQALALNPKAADACLKLAGLYGREGRFKESLHYAEKAESLGVVINPNLLNEIRDKANTQLN